MDIKASIDKDTFGYRNRLLLIALGALFWAGYCVYDAVEGYPKQIERRAQFEALQEKHPEDWKDHWPEMAEANGWDPTKEPNKRTQGDILTQWVMFAGTLPIGLLCLFSVAKWSRRFIGIDETTLYANGGVEVPFDKIARIDASRWDRKGIARVYYTIDDIEKSILIDDFKFERQPTNEIFKRLKEALDEDKIEGLIEPDQEDDKDTEAPDKAESAEQAKEQPA